MKALWLAAAVLSAGGVASPVSAAPSRNAFIPGVSGYSTKDRCNWKLGNQLKGHKAPYPAPQALPNMTTKHPEQTQL